MLMKKKKPVPSVKRLKAIDKLLKEREKFLALPERKRALIRQKKLNAEIHKTHNMTRWRQTIVTLACTPRFGKIRMCRKCEHEQAVTVGGTGTHNELSAKCRGYVL